MNKILVIKHSALGDFVLATGPMKAIRSTHPNARITLLTTKPYAAWGRACGWFDDVWVDSRPSLLQIDAVWQLRRKLIAGKFDRVYDLQTSTRSCAYYYLMKPNAPEWCGIVSGGSHYHANPNRTRMHTLDRQRDQLNAAGIADVPPPDLSWLSGDVAKFGLKSPYILLVPGGSAHRPEKRWPVEYFISACRFVHHRGYTPVLLGAGADQIVVDPIVVSCPYARNLCNQTSFGEIAELARHAVCAIGNDTGPMHMIAAAGADAIILFSGASDPAVCAPRPVRDGQNVRILRQSALKDLHPDVVLAILSALITNQPRHNGASSAAPVHAAGK